MVLAHNEDVRVPVVLRDLRLRCRWTQRQLAERAEVSIRLIGAIEHARAQPTELSKLRILAAINVHLASDYSPDDVLWSN